MKLTINQTEDGYTVKDHYEWFKGLETLNTKPIIYKTYKELEKYLRLRFKK